MDYNEIDEVFDFYEKRYNLTKMISDCGISPKKYKKLDSKNKFLVLSQELRKKKKTNLASFFFGKLFEVSGDLEALINKINCLLELGEFDEALRYNKLGFELFLEDPDSDPNLIEGKLQLQKAIIAFQTDKFDISQATCEHSIIRFKSVEFYELLCANFVALSDFKNAIKLYNKYGAKFSSNFDFIIEVVVYLIDINLLLKVVDFVGVIFKISSKKKSEFVEYINDYYFLDKEKKLIRDFFEEKIKLEDSNIKSHQ